MHIGVAGPVTLSMLSHLVPEPELVPDAYSFPNTASLVLELISRGHTVSVFALSPSVQTYSSQKGEQLRLQVIPMRPRARTRALDFFAEERHGLAAAIQSSDCEVVHAHWTYEFALGAQEAGLPTVVTAHDSPLTVARLNRHPYWWIRAGMAGVAVRRAPILTAVAPPVAAHFRKVYLYPREIAVIPNGIPATIFDRTITAPSAGNPLFVSVANGWGPRKNVASALQAFGKLRQRHPSSRFLLLGAGHGPGEEAQRYAGAAGLSSGCEFVGSVTRDQVLDVLTSGVTALVHPSRFEAHSVAVSEAMALGIVVIGGIRSGGMAWTLGYGSAGLLVDVNDPDAIATAMASTIEPDGTERALGGAGRTRARAHFAAPVVAAEYEAVYASAAGGR